jgi:hypothetical protein
MFEVKCIVEEDVSPKIDTLYVEAELNKTVQSDKNVCIVFICTNESWRPDETWRSKGWKYHTIRLPYERVKTMSADAVKPLMLKLAAERLG